MRYTNYFVFKKDLDANGIEYAARHSKELGFDSVEFLDFYSPDQPILPEMIDIDEAKRVLCDYGLEVSCFSVGINLLELGPKKSVDVLKKYSDTAARLGSPFLHHTLVFPLTLPEDAPSYDDILDGIVETASAVASYCSKLNVTCIYEPQGMYFNGVAGLTPLLTEMKKRATNVGVCGDVGNCLYVDDDPVAVFEAFAPDILHVHMKDYTVRAEKGDNPTTKPSRSGRWLTISEIGAGDIDLVGAMRALKSVDYDGAFALEVKGDDDFMRRSIEYLKSVHCQVYGV